MVSLREEKAKQTKATWRRTVDKEIKTMGLTRGEAEMVALELVGGREWRPHASRGAKSKNKKEKRSG